MPNALLSLWVFPKTYAYTCLFIFAFYHFVLGSALPYRVPHTDRMRTFQEEGVGVIRTKRNGEGSLERYLPFVPHQLPVYQWCGSDSVCASVDATTSSNPSQLLFRRLESVAYPQLGWDAGS